MTLAVLMSVYAGETAGRLDLAMDSIWTHQNRKPDRVILVEDGPLPCSVHEVIEKWQSVLGNSLVVLRNETNLGLTISLNRGLDVISEDLVARMDSDDVSLPERFHIQAAYLENHPDVAVLGSSIQEFDDDNDCLQIRHFPTGDIRKYIAKASPVAHPAVMMRMDLFREGGLRYDERFRTSQDIALWYDALSKGYRIDNVDEVLLKFRRDESAASRRSKSKALGEFKIYVRGIYRLYGAFTWRYIYPVSRLIFRLMPNNFIKLVYNSRLRVLLLQKSR